MQSKSKLKNFLKMRLFWVGNQDHLLSDAIWKQLVTTPYALIEERRNGMHINRAKRNTEGLTWIGFGKLIRFGYQYYSFIQFIRVLIASIFFSSRIVSPNLHVVNPYMQSLFTEIPHKQYCWILTTPCAKHKHLTDVKIISLKDNDFPKITRLVVCRIRIGT